MLTLQNAALRVDLLDPAADRARFGVRYCTGGSIFQITDARHGPLLTGPTYPDAYNTHDGQGIPDAFSHRPIHDPAGGTTALILGVGHCDLVQKTVLEPCRWEVTAGPDARTFRTEQASGDTALGLTRTVTLAHRTVRSQTHIVNTGRRTLPVLWFPHPFFPQPEAPELCRLNFPVTVRENPGYVLAPNGFLARRAWPPPEGAYLALDHAGTMPATILQRHPALGLVAGTCSYVPTLLPVWGNARTFSWEPFFERTLAPGQEADWWIDYSF